MRGKKDLILKTAAKLFFKNGITETSMDDIADEAKIGYCQVLCVIKLPHKRGSLLCLPDFVQE